MKRKRLYLLLILEFCALLSLALLSQRLPTAFSSVIAFPFEQLGAGMRALANAGNVGNGLALAVYVGLSALPLAFAWRRKGKTPGTAVNIALCLLSAVLFAVFYGMANPAAFRFTLPLQGDAMHSVVKAMLGGTAWSCVVLVVVLRLLAMFRAGDKNALIAYVRAMLYALCALFTGGMALSLAGIKGNVLRAISGALPYALDIYITLSALALLDALQKDGQRSTAGCAETLAKRCCAALCITVASQVAANVLKLALSRWLTDIDITASFPVMSVAFVLGALLIARLVAENQKLRDDNEMFI